MVEHNAVLCVALIAVAAIEVVALLRGINGVMLASSLGAICAIAGVKWQQQRAQGSAEGYYPRGGNTGQSAGIPETRAAGGCLTSAPIPSSHRQAAHSGIAA